MVKFFIDRPVFAAVIALFILIGGALAITELPVAQYPTIAPPIRMKSAITAAKTGRSMKNLTM